MYAFYDYFHHEKFLDIPVSLVSELHNYSTRSASSNQVAIPFFRTNLRRFCPSIIGSFFWNDIPQSIRDKPSKKSLKKHFCAGTLLNTNETLSLLQFSELFLFAFTFLLKISESFVIHNFKGHNISFLDVPLSSPSIYNVIQFKCCKFCSTHFFPL